MSAILAIVAFVWLRWDNKAFGGFVVALIALIGLLIEEVLS